jgi:hypothetical protein
MVTARTAEVIDASQDIPRQITITSPPTRNFGRCLTEANRILTELTYPQKDGPSNRPFARRAEQDLPTESWR